MADSKPWYKSGSPHEGLTGLANQIDQRQGYQRAAIIHALRLYNERAVRGFSPMTYASAHRRRDGGVSWDNDSRLSINVVRSCVDTAVSHVCEARPRPTYLTTAGDWSLQTKAKKRSRFVDGSFQHARAYEARRRAVKNMCLFGTGFVKVLQQHGRLEYQSVFPGEILVDDQDGVYGSPRVLIQEKVYDRAVAMKLWPSASAKIKEASAPDARYFGRDPLADQILVREAWHLPSAPGGSDGKHAICTDTATLFSEPWRFDKFPFGVWRWSDEPLGFFGVGLAHQLTGIQLEINSLLLTIQANTYYGANLKVFVEKGSQVPLQHLSNRVKPPIIEYTGNPPVFSTDNVFTPQVFDLLQYYITSAYQITGVSSAQAQSEMPASVQSGRQAQIYANQYSRRFMTVLQGDEQAMMDLAELTIRTAEEIETKYGDLYVAYARNRNWMERIDAKDIIGDDQEFEITAGSTSILPRTVAGRQAMLEGWQALNWVSPAQAKKLADIPDLDAELDLENSPIELIDQRIEKILEEGIVMPPHPRMNLELAHQRATLAFDRAELNGVPADRLDLLDGFIDAIELEIEAAEAAAAAEAAELAAANNPMAGAPGAPAVDPTAPQDPSAAAPAPVVPAAP